MKVPKILNLFSKKLNNVAELDKAFLQPMNSLPDDFNVQIAKLPDHVWGMDSFRDTIVKVRQEVYDEFGTKDYIV